MRCVSGVNIKILTVRQPWATALVAGWKDVENRSWRTNYLGWILIHSARSVDSQVPTRYQLGDPSVLPLGSVIGAVKLLDVIWNSPSVWAEPGSWHWRHDPALAIQLEKPIPWRGTLGLTRVPSALIDILPVDFVRRLTI
jgi:hypothetical protein